MFENLEEIEVEIRQESVKLLQYIEQRDKLERLLNYAPVMQLEKIHQALARLDKVITDTEDILEILKKKYSKTTEMVENDDKLNQMMDKIVPELLKFINEEEAEELDGTKRPLRKN